MPYSPHRIKSIFILTTLILTGITSDSFSVEKTTFRGIFPFPFVSLDKFILKPRSAASMATCEIGTIYVDDNTGELTVCGSNNSKSRNIWEQTGDNVYLTNSAPDLKVSIGAKTASSAFNIFGTPIADKQQNEINLDPLNGINSAGMTLKMNMPYDTSFPARNTTDIHFHAGNRKQDYDGRVLYMNRNNPANPVQGFALFGAYNVMNMWIDKTTHRIGIGTNQPTERLDIIGDIETNKIILDQDGTLGADLPADLKVSYSPVAGSEGYYAVYAP